ncbi:uroporphyrinogen-III synthase [Paracoccus sp. p4-l81]|uniref:uroporphyrinogen-III synthase n=1 Tax=Paracoccus sp. p4-l81 TaxID=3342806 RepID=UPI0035B6D8B9
MTARPPTILLTRPAPAAARFAALLAQGPAAACPVLASPLMRIELLTPPADQIAAARAADQVIFSSENGVAGLAALMPSGGRRAWCVGDRTAQAARAAGYDAVAAQGDAPSLRALIGAAAPRGRLVHARGRHIVAPLADQLTAGGLPCDQITVYDQVDLPLSGAARDLLAGAVPVLVALFSPRSARLFAAAAGGARAPLWVAAISAAVGQAAAPLAPARLAIAARPDADAMAAAIADLIAHA